MIERDDIQSIVQAVLDEIDKQRSEGSYNQPKTEVAAADTIDDRTPDIDLPDPTIPKFRHVSGIAHPIDSEGLRALMATTPYRIGVGRAGQRPRTAAMLLFRADHAVTQDALMHEVNSQMLKELGLFVVESQAIISRKEYLKRPDLGRKLTGEAKRILNERCKKKPDVQIFVGDGLSGAAIDSNLPKIMPVLKQGFEAAGLSVGTPFFVKNARVGLLNSVNSIIDAKVCAILIGERPGLARAESMSIYMGYRPQPDSTDADRNVICNIYEGGFNPLEAGASAVRLVQRMIESHMSGVRLDSEEKMKQMGN